MPTMRWLSRIDAGDAVARQAVTSSEGGKRLRALLTLDSLRAFAADAAKEADFDAVLDLACAGGVPDRCLGARRHH